MVLISPAARESRTDLTVALVTEDVYSVMTDRETLGFVHKVGTVFVALERRHPEPRRRGWPGAVT